MERFWRPIRHQVALRIASAYLPTLSIFSRLSARYPPAGGSLMSHHTPSIAPLVPKNGQFRVLAASDTGFAQLREGPFVLIGAFDNPWTMRITQDLPIGFDYDDHVRKVVNRRSAPKDIWTRQ
jgi:hypothetical protein